MKTRMIVNCFFRKPQLGLRVRDLVMQKARNGRRATHARARRLAQGPPAAPPVAAPPPVLLAVLGARAFPALPAPPELLALLDVQLPLLVCDNSEKTESTNGDSAELDIDSSDISFLDFEHVGEDLFGFPAVPLDVARRDALAREAVVEPGQSSSSSSSSSRMG